MLIITIKYVSIKLPDIDWFWTQVCVIGVQIIYPGW